MPFASFVGDVSTSFRIVALCLVTIFSYWCPISASPTTQDGADNKPRDYCQSEYFSVNCTGVSDVILMESARYGRMQAGRCVSGYGKLGCYTDVLWYMDRRCSGRRHCRVYVADPVLHHVDVCHSDLTSYLEAKYACVTAAPGNSKSAASSQCRRTRRLVLNAADPLTVRYLSSEATIASGGIGTSECPFRIHASPGQRIRLSLVAFIGESRTEDPDGEDPELAGSNTPRPGLCYEVGTVTAGGDRADDSQPLTACGLPADRQPSSPSVLYQSDTSNITIQLYPIPVLQRLAPFVIKFEALGCPTLMSPRQGWVTVNRRTATVGCNSTGEEYQLSCDGRQWSGRVPNCTAHGALTWQTTSMLFQSSDDAFPYGILLVVALGVALGIFAGGTLLTIVAFCMKKGAAASAADVVNPCETETLRPGDIYNRYPSSTPEGDCSLYHQYHHRQLQQQQQQQQQHLPVGYGHERRYPGVGLDVDYDQTNLDVGRGGLMEFTAGGKFVGHLYESPHFDQVIEPSVVKATAT